MVLFGSANPLIRAQALFFVKACYGESKRNVCRLSLTVSVEQLMSDWLGCFSTDVVGVESLLLVFVASLYDVIKWKSDCDILPPLWVSL